MFDAPVPLAAWTVLGAFLATSSFLWGTTHRVGQSHPLLLVCAALVLLGLVALYWGANRLRNGVGSEHWPAETVEPLRNVVRHPAWTVGTIVLLILLVLALVWRSHHNAYFWGVFFLLQAQTQLSNALNRPRTRQGPEGFLDWSKVAPLQSDHWGEP